LNFLHFGLAVGDDMDMMGCIGMDGSGVLVDGLDFSDDKLLQGRTYSYSDTQRYRVGANYLQLPVNQPKCPVATNQRDGCKYCFTLLSFTYMLVMQTYTCSA
jgi:hypothetical protein